MTSTGYIVCSIALCLIAVLLTILGFINHAPIAGLMWAAGCIALSTIAAHAAEFSFMSERQRARDYKGSSV